MNSILIISFLLLWTHLFLLCGERGCIFVNIEMYLLFYTKCSNRILKKGNKINEKRIVNNVALNSYDLII